MKTGIQDVLKLLKEFYSLCIFSYSPNIADASQIRNAFCDYNQRGNEHDEALDCISSHNTLKTTLCSDTFCLK